MILSFSFLSKNDEMKEEALFTGPPFLVIHPDQTLLCTSCEKCQVVCPTSCIELSGNDQKNPPTSFQIDMINCVYCGLCEEVCPDDAIYMSRELPPIFTDANGPGDFLWGIDKLAFRKSLNQGKGIVVKDGELQFQSES
jgi:NADH-quinone oxidoreductase subunit I